MLRVEALRTHDQTNKRFVSGPKGPQGTQATNLLPSLQILLKFITLPRRSEVSPAADTRRRLQLPLSSNHEYSADLGSGSKGEVRPLNGDNL
jgi:hypothetical protein